MGIYPPFITYFPIVYLEPPIFVPRSRRCKAAARAHPGGAGLGRLRSARQTTKSQSDGARVKHRDNFR